MPKEAQLTCPICKRTLVERKFVADKSNEVTGRAEMCMDCMCTGIDNRKPVTFLHVLQHFDKPFIESVWAKATNKAYQKDPKSFGPTSVIGSYLRTMSMTQYSTMRFKHSDKTIGLLEITRPPQIRKYWGDVLPIELTDEEPEKPQVNTHPDKIAVTEGEKIEKRILASQKASASNSRTAAMLSENKEEKPKDDNGYDGTAGSKILEKEIRKAAKAMLDASNPQPQETPEEKRRRMATEVRTDGMIAGLNPSLQVDNDAVIMNSLTEEDQMYLIGKWGAYYTPSQWVKMERMYREYADEYDLNIDRAETLKKICSTSVKMDEALEMGDVNAYKNLSAVYGQLRKDGKFTEAQNKTEVARPFDTIGEIVRLCEDEGGPIPEWGDPDMYPQDQLDVILNDYKEYVFHLVKNEMGLGQIIEKYVEKLEQAERDKEDAMLKSLRSDLSAEDLDANVARMNLAEAIKREAEQLDYNDSSTYRTKMQNERRRALDEVVDDVT